MPFGDLSLNGILRLFKMSLSKKQLGMLLQLIPIWVPEGFSIYKRRDLLLGNYWQESVKVYLSHSDDNKYSLEDLRGKTLKGKFLELHNGVWEPSKEDIKLDLFMMALYVGICQVRYRMNLAIERGTFIPSDWTTRMFVSTCIRTLEKDGYSNIVSNFYTPEE